MVRKKSPEEQEHVELFELKCRVGELIRDVIKRTGEGEITDMIGYGGNKYGEEMTIPYGKKSVYWCDYYQTLEFIDGEPVESLKDIPKILKLISYLEEKLEGHKSKRFNAGELTLDTYKVIMFDLEMLWNEDKDKQYHYNLLKSNLDDLFGVSIVKKYAEGDGNE